LCASSRNLSDAQLDVVAASGGVVGINFTPAFLREDGADEPATPISEIVRHVDYVASRIGVDHVAFGSDFEGATMPAELGGASGLPRLVELLRGRYADDDVAKITHGNWLRVLAATWRPWGRYLAAAGDDPRPTLLDALARFESPASQSTSAPARGATPPSCSDAAGGCSRSIASPKRSSASARSPPRRSSRRAAQASKRPTGRRASS
jgi:hypothetical protein